MRLLKIGAMQQQRNLYSPVPAGVTLWLRADEGVTYGVDDKVSQWNDQSGNDYHAVNHLIDIEPIYVASGINGLPTIDFEGGTLILGSGLGMFRNKAGCTIAIVKQTKAAVTGVNVKCIFRGTTAHTDGDRARVNLEEGRTGNRYNVSGRRLDTDSFVVRNGTSDLTGSPIIQTGVYDWANALVYLYINGVSDNNTTSFQTEGNSADTDSQLISIGSGATNTVYGQNLNGYISEILVYDRVLSAGDFTSLHNYLLNKYGI